MSGRFKAFLGLTIFLGVFNAQTVFAAAPFSDNFDSYTAGNLNGQGSWVASGPTVTSTGCQSGSCATTFGYGSDAYKIGTSTFDGSWDYGIDVTHVPTSVDYQALVYLVDSIGNGAFDVADMYKGSSSGFSIKDNRSNILWDNVPLNSWHTVTLSWTLIDNECHFYVDLDHSGTPKEAQFGGSPVGCHSTANSNYPKALTNGIDELWIHSALFGGNFILDNITDGGGANTSVATGTISVSTEWGQNSTHIISGPLIIDSGVTLTIDSGTVIKFNTATSSLIVNGTLNASGTSTPIFFTSLKDDLIGGDTNRDGHLTSPSAGDWAGIKINSGGTANLDSSVVRYGGSVDGSGGMIDNNGGILNISTSTIAYGSGYGILNSLGTTTVTTSDLGFNNYGLYLNGGNASITATSTIHDNALFGVYNNTTATSSVFAEGNYWATSTATTTGPYNATYNPSGTGNAVSDYVDFFPWIGTSTSSSLPHYVTELIDPDCLPDTCWSVNNGWLRLDASTTPASYLADLSVATSTWNTLGSITIDSATSSSATELYILPIYDASDIAEKGDYQANYVGQPGKIHLNTYFLDSDTSSERQNTIEHELGHALGLAHSYTGNIMFLNQSTQSVLGPQDISDYYYLWP